MSSAISTSKKSLFSTFPAKHHVSNQDEPEKNEPVKEEPKDQTSAWQPGGYTPSRTNWHTVRGKIQRLMS